MVSLLPPQSAPESGRISQFLPSVKCSDCNQPVPIRELEDHVCAVPPVPSVPTSSSLSSLLPQRLQSLVSLPRSNSAKLPLSPDTPKNGKYPSPRRSRGFSISSKKARTSPTPTPTPTPTPPVPPGPSITSNSVIPPVQPPPRKASRDLFQPSTTSGSTPSPIPFPVVSSRTRAPSVTSNNTSVYSRPSLDASRNRTPSVASQPRPSIESSRSRNLSTATTSSIGRPSYDSLRARTPDNSQLRVPALPSPSNITVFPGRSDANRLPQSHYNESSVHHFTSHPPSIPVAYEPSTLSNHHQSHRRDEPDTKIGGEAGMAGVGRRGFQAAARAALLTVSSGTDRGRPNAPHLLDIGRAINSTFNLPCFLKSPI
jgi:hypothetical protein